MGIRGDIREGNHVGPTAESAPGESASILKCEEDLDFHSSLLDAIGDGVIAHTLDGRVIYVNQAACDIYGFCRSEFQRLEPWGWVPQHARDILPARIAEIHKPKGAIFAGVGPPHEDGTPMYTEIHARLCETIRDGTIAVLVVHDATDRVLAEKHTRHMALHDTLTGLPNRRLLLERMQQALVSADRHGDIVGVVYADLDDFKPVNDTLGHATGDEVLKIIADRLRSCMRESDTVSRVGGDEFVALFPRLEAPEDLAVIALSIARCIDDPIHIRGHEVTVTTSLGLALYAQGEATDELITRADHAMYRAKQDGVSGWEEYLHELLASRA